MLRGTAVRCSPSRQAERTTLIPPSRKRHTPEISVIFPLVDARGHGVEEVRSWTHLQTLPRDRFQVIAVSDGSDVEAEEQTARLLAPHDRLIRRPTQNFIELYDVGIRQAEGRLVVLTEHHCIARPDCLAEVEAFFQQPEFDGACLNVEWICLNELARLNWTGRNKERLSCYEAPDHWSKFLFGGFAIYRDILMAVGGLDYQYGLFLEVAMAAKLHALGYRLGRAERAVVQHLDNNNFSKVLHFVRDYTEGEIKFLAGNDPAYCERYVGHVPEWERQHSYRQAVSRATSRLLGRILWKQLWSGNRHHRHRASTAVGLAAELVRQVPAAVVPPIIHLLAVYLGVITARLRFAFWWFNQSRRLRALNDACNRMVHYVRLKSIMQQNFDDCSTRANPVSNLGTVSFDVGQMSEAHLIGCHAREIFEGESFRWTEPVATLRLDVPPQDYEVTIDTHALRGPAADFLLACFWNHRRMNEGTLHATDGGSRFLIRRDDFASESPQHLTLVCRPLLPREQGVADDRRLGMPIFSIRFNVSSVMLNEPTRPSESNDTKAA